MSASTIEDPAPTRRLTNAQRDSVGATPATSDLLNLTGATSTVTFGGPTWNLNISNIGGGDPTGQTYVLVDYTGANPAALPTINFTGPLGGNANATEHDRKAKG